MAVDARSDADLQFGTPHALFTNRGLQSFFEVMPDGREFLIATTEGAMVSGAATITILAGWPALLKK